MELRPGTRIISFVPKLAKMASQAFPKPSPYASSITTVAMPHAIPSMVSAVRRRLWRLTARLEAAPFQNTFFIRPLLLPQRFHGLQHRRFARGIKSRDHSCDGEASDRQDRRRRNQFWRIEASWPLLRTQNCHEPGGQSHANQAAE